MSRFVFLRRPSCRIFWLAWACLGSLSASIAISSELPKDQDFLIRNWDQDDGLPSTRLDSVARTRDGYVWMATYGGLARFDGARFTTFNQEAVPALHTDVINCLWVDQSGALWIGTTVGTLVKWEKGRFEEIKLPENYAGSFINTIAEDSHGAIWVGFDRVGMLRIRDQAGMETVRAFNSSNGLPEGNVTQLQSDKAGKLWAVVAGRLMFFEDEHWQNLAPTNQPAEMIRLINKANDGGLWVATFGPNSRGSRIFKFKNARWQEELSPYPWPQNLVRSRAQAVFEDKQGKLWCATAGGGVFSKRPGQTWERLVSAGPPSHMDALCFMEDESGVIWIGTRTAGLYQIRPRPVRILALPEDANQNIVQTVCAARDGSVWCGTDGAGVFHWQNNGLSRSGPEQGLGNPYVNVMYEDSQTNLWAGTMGGLFQWRGKRFEPVTGSPSFATPVMSIYEDREKNLWVGTRGGLIQIHDKDVRQFTGRDGLGGAPVRAMVEDEHGRLLVSIETAGIYCQQGERFAPLPNTPTALTNGVRAMLCDDDGIVWFATRSAGLFALKDGTFRQWDYANDGLPSDHHFSLVEDDAKNLWISSESGIFGFTKNNLDNYERNGSSRLAPWRLSQTEGLAYKVCSGGGQPAGMKSADGLIWFGDGPTVAVFNPAVTPRNLRVWPPLVEEVLADGEPLASDPKGNFQIKSGAATYEFRYTSPNIIAPQRIKFRYQLTGVDKSWVEANDRRVAYYTHLLPGRYQFKVQAASPNSEWHDTTGATSLIVAPRIYERRAVQITAAFLLLAIVGLTVWRMERNRSHRRLERLRLQNAMEKERHRIARDIHDDLGSGLTEIILLSDNLRDELPAAPASEKMVGEISTRARALTRTMDEVVWAINPRNDTVEGLLTYLNKFAQEYLSRAGIRCRMDVPMELPSLPLAAQTRHHLYLACKEALNNLVKHARATEVWIRFQTEPDGFKLSFEDNGRGFNIASDPERGNGLQNMRRRLEELGGRCEIQSDNTTGTRVVFHVPANQPGPHPNGSSAR